MKKIIFLLIGFLFLSLALNFEKTDSSGIKTTNKFSVHPYQEGEWNFTAKPAHMPGNPNVADLNGDGYKEVVLGAYNGKVYAWQYNGTILPGWPQTVSRSNRIFSSPAIADVNLDGKLDVIVGATDFVCAWSANGTELPGWPKEIHGWFQSSPALADIDGDTDLEVIIGGNDSYVYAWHHDGNNVEGWPQKTGDRITSSPAIGDLIPSKPGLEIVVGSEDNYTYAWHSNGSLVNGFPVDLGEQVVISSPALGDITGDGKLEIIIGTYPHKGLLYVIKSDGTFLQGWPKPVCQIGLDNSGIFGSPALGDLTGNGKPEIVVLSLNGLLTVLNQNGELWSVEAFIVSQSSPTIADIDGDEEPEIIVAGTSNETYQWSLTVYERYGSKVKGWPVEVFDYGTQSQPTVADLDEDGDIELILATGTYGPTTTFGELFVFDLQAPLHPNMNYWPMFRANKQHSGELSPNLKPWNTEIGSLDLLIILPIFPMLIGLIRSKRKRKIQI